MPRARFHNVDVEIVDRLDEGIELQIPARAARRMEILAHAFAQIARFADVDDRAEPILVHTPGLCGTALSFCGCDRSLAHRQVTGGRSKLAKGAPTEPKR